MLRVGLVNMLGKAVRLMPQCVQNVKKSWKIKTVMIAVKATGLKVMTLQLRETLQEVTTIHKIDNTLNILRTGIQIEAEVEITIIDKAGITMVTHEAPEKLI